MKPESPFVAILLSALTSLTFTSEGKADENGASWRGQSVTEFTAEENARMRWQIVNDGVMGGLSEGKVEFTGEGIMKFSGTLSLQNNGGFTTARSEPVDLNLSNDLGLLLLVKGDGRTYQARLDSDALYRGMPVSFSGEFTTTKGEWQQIKIPFSDFKGSWRGADLPDEKLNPADIRKVWILLGDKKEGPFTLEVDWIRTYGKGQGSFTARPNGSSPAVAAKTSQGPSKVIETVAADGRFGTLMKALDAAGLTPFFQWDNKLTVFAPTDEAFAKLPVETLSDLLKPENKEQLISLLSHHVVTGQVLLSDALAAKEAKTIHGAPLTITFTKGDVLANNAVLVDADMVCSNGVIHVVDSILLPPR
jgi:monofunctional biosynthetic peptidoglycan transglycosylase